MKSLSTIVLLALTVSFLPACVSLFSSEKDNNHETVVSMIEHFHNGGMKITQLNNVYFEMVGAKSGAAVFIDGKRVEIYKYDQRLEKQKRKLDKIKEEETITVFGKTFPVVINGSFIIINYNMHPKKTEIIKLFKSF